MAAADLPYSVEYTSTADSLTTTFHIKVGRLLLRPACCRAPPAAAPSSPAAAARGPHPYCRNCPGGLVRGGAHLPRPAPQVCSTGCTAGAANCQALKAFRLRLSDRVLATPSQFIKMANPQGAVVADCASPGWWIKDSELLSLAAGPAQVRC